MNSDLLTELLQAVDAPQARYAELQRYATGTQPQAFLSPMAREYLDKALAKMVVNVPALAVQSISERLRVAGFSDPRAWDLFTNSDLDQLIPQALSDALTYGCGYVLVWGRGGRPVATVESPFECAVLRDPADRSVVAGVKRYRTKDTNEAFVYLADRVEHWRASSPGAGAGFTLIETIDHDLGMVPLVVLDNGHSEITDLMPLCDALGSVVLDMCIASRRGGFGRAWVTGLELTEREVLDADGNPVLDGDGNPVVAVVNPVNDLVTVPMAVAENPDTKFGNFAEPSLSGFETAVRVLVSMIMSVSALPSHYLGVLNSQPTSADALRSAESSLVARVEQRQLTFGRSLEQIGKLLIAVSTGAHVENLSLRVSWSPADTRSEAQLSDSVVKLVQANILPVSYALKKLGYSDDEITLIRAAKRAEILDAQGIGLAANDDE